jgi:hypothetical protein
MEPGEIIIDERELEALRRDIAALVEAGERKLHASAPSEPPAAAASSTESKPIAEPALEVAGAQRRPGP